MAKITLDDIMPISRYEALSKELDNLAKESVTNEGRFNLLLDFINQNKEKLEQQIEISKERVSGVVGEEKNMEFYQSKGIFLAMGSHYYREPGVEEKLFYIPEKNNFLKVKASYSKNYLGGFLATGITTIKTLRYGEASREEVMKNVKLFDIVRDLNEFLGFDREKTGRFSFSDFCTDGLVKYAIRSG